MGHTTNALVAASVALVIAGAVQAQDAGQTDDLDQVTVSGSRIKRAVGMTTPTPVAALSADELASLAPASVTEALVQLPQFYNSQTAESFSGTGYFQSQGGGSMNLRGLGSKRTLTLLNGRRSVNATVFGGPDVSMFPDQVLQRVEVVTGGASASYGTDAVSGVVNYILDTDFEGVRASAQMGITDRHDAKNEKYAISVGHAFGDKAHLLFSASHAAQDEVIGWRSRDWYKGCGLIQNPGVPANVAASAPQTVPPTWNPATFVAGNGGYSQSTPRLVAGCDLHNTLLTYDGMLAIGANRYELQADGTPIPWVSTLPTTGPAAGTALQVGGGGQNLFMDTSQVSPQTSHNNVFTYLDYDVSDNLNVYLQHMRGWQTLRSFGRVGDFSSGPPNQAFTIYRNNAFLPTSVGQLMDAAGATTATLTRAMIGGDLGTWTNISKVQSSTLGFKSTIKSGGFFNGWDVDGYAQFGKSSLDAEQADSFRLDRVYLASDAVDQGQPTSTTAGTRNGNIVCRVNAITPGAAPGCVPLNLFGRNNISPTAIDWVQGFDPNIPVTVNPYLGLNANGQAIYGDPYSYMGDEAKHRVASLKQNVFEISASGKVHDGWAGEINAAFGASYRKESVVQRVQASQGNRAADPTYYPVWCPDASLVSTEPRCLEQVAEGIRPPGNIGVRGVPGAVFRNTVEIQFSNVPFISGSFDVKEAFGEVNVPLLAGLPGLEKLTFQGALRWADYGGSGTIWSYKTGLDAAITSELRLRGTFSHDTRAANIGERFDRTGGFTGNITDRVTPLPTGWIQPSAVTTVNGGNPDLTPEEADTYTLGAVYRPQWLPGLDISVDWLSVSLKGAIEQLLAQRVVDMCHLDGSAEQCARIVRDPTTNVLLFVPQTNFNLAKARQESVDIEMGYSHPVTLLGGAERMGVRLFGTYMLENSTTNDQGIKTDATQNLVLQNFDRKVTAVFSYDNGPFGWNITSRYNGGGRLGTIATMFNLDRTLNNTAKDVATVWDVADATVGASVFWDTRFSYEIPVSDGKFEVFANITNVFDRAPPSVLQENLQNQTLPNGNGVYDILGRRFLVGFNLKF